MYIIYTCSYIDILQIWKAHHIINSVSDFWNWYKAYTLDWVCVHYIDFLSSITLSQLTLSTFIVCMSH